MAKKLCDRDPQAPPRAKLGRKPKAGKDVTDAVIKRLTKECEHIPRAIPIEPSDMQDTTLSALIELFAKPAPDLDVYEQVEAAAVDYFKWCDRHKAIPSYASLALALHMDRRTFFDWSDGKVRAYDPRYSQLIKSCAAVITSYTEMSGAKGDIQPLYAMFLLNNSRQGYVNQSRVELSQAPQSLEAPDVSDVIDVYSGDFEDVSASASEQ